MSNKPTSSQIAAFTHVARERSSSRAATTMGVTQSAITHHIGKLEKIVGARLFLRRRDGLELTTTALELFALTDRLRSLEKQVTERILDLGKLSSGYLKIIANVPLPALPLIAHYSALYPDVRVELTLASWNVAMNQLQTGDIDIALIVQPDEDTGFCMEAIRSTRYRCFMRSDHPLARRESVSLEHLATEVVILPEDGSLTQKVFERKVAAFGIQQLRVLKTATFPLARRRYYTAVGSTSCSRVVSTRPRACSPGQFGRWRIPTIWRW